MATLRALNLRFSARARSQLVSIQAYIDERNPVAAARVGAAIRDVAERLRYFPLAKVRALPQVQQAKPLHF